MPHASRWRFALTLFAGLILLFAIRASADEVLVLTTATTIPLQSISRKAVAIRNQGPNSIFCELAPKTPVVDKAWEIKPDTWQSFKAGPNRTVKCIAATANQVTANATIVLEAW